MIKNLLLIIFCSALIFSCSKKKEDNSAEFVYTKAMKILKDKRYIEAAESFEKIDDDYPLSKWAIKGQIMAAYAYYKEAKYDDVVRVVEDFVRVNPGNENIAYMQYLKALSYYNRIPNIERGQDYSQMASYAFRELIARFPDDFHSEDARKKIVIVDEHLAGAKMNIGRYHLKNQNYVGAIKSFTDVIDGYKQTSQSPEAYFRLMECYYKIGLKDEAKKSFKELERFPDSRWHKYGKKLMRS